MMRKKIAGMLLITSVVGGVAAGVMANAFTSDGRGEHRALRKLSDSPVLGPPPLMEVKNPLLVMNDDGTATLSAVVLNSARRPMTIGRATAGEPGDWDAAPLLVHGLQDVGIEPNVPLRVGGVGDPYRIRFAEPVPVGSVLPMTIEFRGGRHFLEPGPAVVIHAKVVARTPAHADVANNGPNAEISVHEAKIVVVPGQAKAFIGGWFESTIDDVTELRPVSVSKQGAKIDVLHQTATGGPSGFFAQAGEKTSLGYDNYLDAPGDRDYVRASDVKVGQTVKITFRFPSGDVVARFKVVQGNADGTV